MSKCCKDDIHPTACVGSISPGSRARARTTDARNDDIHPSEQHNDRDDPNFAKMKDAIYLKNLDMVMIEAYQIEGR